MTAARIPGVNFSHAPSFPLLRKAVEFGERESKQLYVGPVFTTDAFYQPDPELAIKLAAHGTVAVEMEAAALYAVAAAEGVEALMLGTVSDHVLKTEEMSAEDREKTFQTMVEFALASLA